ncbi:hypothetical protein [Sphingopyxis sp. NJF-3]
MVDMIATKKLKYGTRRLLPGDPFSARHDRDAKLLIGIGKARYATRDMVAEDEPVIAAPVELPNAPAPEPVEPAPIPEAAEADERPALRAEYETKFGKKPFMGWDAAALREKLAAE